LRLKTHIKFLFKKAKTLYPLSYCTMKLKSNENLGKNTGMNSLLNCLAKIKINLELKAEAEVLPRMTINLRLEREAT
jgi:hypothetical protein